MDLTADLTEKTLVNGKVGGKNFSFFLATFFCTLYYFLCKKVTIMHGEKAILVKKKLRIFN